MLSLGLKSLNKTMDLDVVLNEGCFSKIVEYAKNKFKENYNKPEFHQEVLNTLKDYQAGWFNIT